MKMGSEKLRPSAEDADEVEAVAAMTVSHRPRSDSTLRRRCTPPCWTTILGLNWRELILADRRYDFERLIPSMPAGVYGKVYLRGADKESVQQ